jgi:hypothetical protein
MLADQVKEIQGLYGPFTLSERVVQKIWLRQDFETSDLTTVSGQSVVVKDPGRWNLLGGPDFKEARLVIDGQSVVGDVEVHFTASDWYAHGHERNPEFNQVVLHVVLHEEKQASALVKTLSGKEPELLVLLPRLERDLESYAIDEALLELEQVDDLEWVARFLEKPLEERRDVVDARARERWEQKLAFARKRLESAGWAEACHQLCLEVLGYSRNRAPMSQIALQYPMSASEWSTLDAATLFDLQVDRWRLSGLRPANHPRKRLEQYLQLLQHDRQWSETLRQVLSKAASVSESVTTTVVRRSLSFPERSDAIRMELFGGIIGEKRFNTMMVDAFLPLATAAGMIDGFPYWLHWWPGDSPVALSRFLKHGQLTSRQQPLTNGLIQGALALSLNRGV